MDRGFCLHADNVSKTYPLYSGTAHRFKEAVLGRAIPHHGRVFPALAEVTFTVQAGEAFGVLGRNGAGKSTLLQILAGVLAPTSGTVRMPPRVAGLLELGSGFNPEFSGRENIYLNAAILGMGRREVHAKMDEILAFADIGTFIDQPVRTYSSGMFLRLAFAVSTSVEPDVMLVDEALAVGDIFFRQKCYARLNALREKGMATLIVSHSIADIRQFCRRALVLEHGRIVFLGPADDAVQVYMQMEQKGAGEDPVPRLSRPATSTPAVAVDPDGSDDQWWTRPEVISLELHRKVEAGPAEITRLLLTDDTGVACNVFDQGQVLRVYSEIRVIRNLNTPLAGLGLRNDRGVIVHGKNSLQFDLSPPAAIPPGSIIRVIQEITLAVAYGEYTVEVGFADIPEEIFANRGQYSQAELDDILRKLCHVSATVIAVVASRVSSPCQFSHYGEVDLPGRQTLRVEFAR